MIRWFARNDVAANLLMIFIVCVGFHSVSNRLVLEVFPEFESETVRVSLAYRGATPEEMEESLVVKVEEVISDLPGVKEIQSSASEGSGSVTIEVEDGVDPRRVLDDVKGRVDAISTFPEDAERPTFGVTIRRRETIGVVVSGHMPEAELRRLGERVRDELMALPEVSQVDLTEVRPFEISIDVSEAALQQYGLTFDEVAQAVSRSSIDVPAGSLKTRGGEIRLRSKGQFYTGEEYGKLVVVRRRDGTRVTLGELAEIRDGFEEEAIKATFNGEPCVVLEVYRVGSQNALTLANQVKDYVATAQLPPGAKLTWWRDRSDLIEKRLDTLTSNAWQGALLVIIILGLFLRPSLAAWVCLGIPVSFLGALAVLPIFGITINVLSVFAFILVLGIVVDDAIVTGENIATRLRSGEDPETAAIEGTEEVALPVTFGVLTTVAAFLPLFFLEGRRGAFFGQIPYVVIPVLLFSLIESKFVLPAHLKHLDMTSERGWLGNLQEAIARSLELFAERLYQPLLKRAVWARYLTLAVFVVALAIITAQVGSGQIRFVFFPRVQSETARGSLVMPEGTSFELTDAYVQKMADAARELQAETTDPETGEKAIIDILATSGSAGGTRGQPNVGRVTFEIAPPEERVTEYTSNDLVQRWRETIGPLPGAQELNFRAEIGRGGDPIAIQLRGPDVAAMRELSAKLQARLATYEGVFDIADSYSQGKPELRIRLKGTAESLGLSQEDLARQVRQGFFGLEVQRIQRNRDDVRVVLRYPQSERDSLGHLEMMRVRTSDGRAVPFVEVAEVVQDTGPSTISRYDRQRVLDITADVDKDAVAIGPIAEDLQAFLEAELKRYPAISYRLEGELREQQESFTSLSAGVLFVLLAIYALLAIPFQSYLQPLIVMSVIPFGWAGAVVGHQLLGLDLSIFSVLGLLALTGVVVNDSLVLVDFVNRALEEGQALLDAVHDSGVKRFRAVLLTSLTTFAGLLPLLFEKSTQAQFLIPMAVSLAFGVLLSTFVTLILVPVGVVILEDARVLGRGLKSLVWDLESPDFVWPGDELAAAPEEVAAASDAGAGEGGAAPA